MMVMSFDGMRGIEPNRRTRAANTHQAISCKQQRSFTPIQIQIQIQRRYQVAGTIMQMLGSESRMSMLESVDD
jgi:hypothetical protein